MENRYKELIQNCLLNQQSLQKQLPDNMVFLPLYVLGIMKNRACCKDEINRKFDVDFTNFLRIRTLSFSIKEILAFIYPRIYDLNDLFNTETVGEYDSNGEIVLPNVMIILP